MAGEVVEKPSWTEEADARLRQLLADGLTVTECAVALDRTRPSVAKREYKLRLRDPRTFEKAKRDRIRELAGEGWRSSRIALRLGLPIDVVEHWRTAK
ncbi:hypothetical protein NPA31_018850 [Aurantimonas sp. MSK8Z-1]|uniref:hypothetical protein n=1 Tax=Mangrovibrevibacter kandeliae TaxID=2968473 RepID=UPI00211846EA|nr:hypothetical protein [Aurantimonas sp. MSK8Z-1]MCW4117023.1 hypothetical protein [Aurantimonas sp. MSK8Z-1]